MVDFRLSIVFLFAPSHFPARATRSLAVAFFALALFGTPACRRGISPEQKALRAELKVAMQENSADKAAEIARRILKETPRDNGTWARLVKAQLVRQDLPAANQALAEWRRAVRKNSPKRSELTGDVAMQDGNTAAALEAWSKALAGNRKNLRVLKKLARGYRAHRQWSEEDAALTALIALEDNAATHILRARCRRQQHRWSEAFEDVSRARQLAPQDADVRQSAQLFERLEKFLAPIRELDARIALTPADDQLITDRALLFLRSEDPELALQDAAAAASLAPWAVRPKLLQAIALQDIGRDEEALRIGVAQGLRLETLTSDFLETVARLDAEISLERNNAELYVARGWQLNDIGQPTLALEDARIALEKNADSAGAYLEGGYALAKLGRMEEAYAQIKRATELDPKFSTAWDYRGELEMARHEYAAAIESLSRALAITPTYTALQKREQAYRQLGKAEKADEDRHTLEALNVPELK
jgi:tetratricopeptide (TPR) repeat protein